MIKIVMAYDEGRRQVGEITSRRAKAYAEKWGYQFVLRNDIAHLRNPYWNKVAAIRQELKGCDWVFWLDADAYINDFSFQAESLIVPDKNLIISKDYNGICVGVFLLRVCEWSSRLMDTLDFIGPVSGYLKTNDQETLKRLVMDWQEVGRQVGHIPEQLVQNPGTITDREPFIFHYWTQWNRTDFIVEKMRAAEKRGWHPGARLINSPGA